MDSKICLVEIHIAKLIDGELRFLVLKRSANEKYPNVWQPITGHTEEGEKTYETAFREIEEEIGFKANGIYVIPQINSFYDYRTDRICNIPVFFCLVDDNFEPRISDEHSEYIWANAEQNKNLLAWEGQKKSVDLIIEYFPEKKEILNFIKLNGNNID